MTKALMILLDGIDETQRRLIHAQIKGHAQEWWHEMPDVWMVLTDEPVATWHNRLKVFVPSQPGFLMIFSLPDQGRQWSASGVPSKWKWIRENYSAPTGNPRRQLPVGQNAAGVRTAAGR
jgi:hypothetical protein